MILFGIHSPIVVEYEETCRRLGLAVSAGVSVNDAPRMVDGSKIVLLDEFEAGEDREFIACAFKPQRRKELTEIAHTRGLTLSEALVDPHAIMARTVRVGDGTFVNAGAIVGAVSMIGEGVLVNRATSLGHHTVLGDYVSVGPGATLAGNIRVGAGTIIGAGAIVLPDIRIGENAIVAAGSLVRKDVPDGAFVAGNPAKERTFDAKASSLNLEDGA